MLVPDFSGGLLPAIAQDAASGEVLMLAWMNEQAWEKTLETGIAHYWSRSRQKLWQKGESSGHVQKICSILLDCDKDSILLKVQQVGNAACHTGHRSCFYRKIVGAQNLECSPMIFDPREIYGNSRPSTSPQSTEEKP